MSGRRSNRVWTCSEFMLILAIFQFSPPCVLNGKGSADPASKIRTSFVLWLVPKVRKVPRLSARPAGYRWNLSDKNIWSGFARSSVGRSTRRSWLATSPTGQARASPRDCQNVSTSPFVFYGLVCLGSRSVVGCLPACLPAMLGRRTHLMVGTSSDFIDSTKLSDCLASRSLVHVARKSVRHSRRLGGIFSTYPPQRGRSEAQLRRSP